MIVTMKTPTIKQVTAHALIGGISIFLSLVAFEGIMFIALPGQEVMGTKRTKMVNESAGRVSEMLTGSSDSRRVTGQKKIACGTDFYAVFEVNATPTCIRNPTPLMAHWGPPSPAWFRSLGGGFHSTGEDTTPANLCACLSKQSGYEPGKSTRGDWPIDHVLFGDILVPINKWVCGDPCVTVAKGDSHEF